MKTDAERIEEIEAYTMAATDNPWTFDTLPTPYGDRPRVYGDGKLIAVFGSADTTEQDEWENNTRFCAFARSDVPWLLSQLKAERARAERLEAALRKIAIERNELTPHSWVCRLCFRHAASPEQIEHTIDLRSGLPCPMGGEP